MIMRAYCGMRNAEICSADPVPEYTCVRYTCVVAVGRHEKNLDVKHGSAPRRKTNGGRGHAHAHEPKDLVLPVNDTYIRQTLTYQDAEDRRHDNLRHREPTYRTERHHPPRAPGNLEPRERRAQADEAQRHARRADKTRRVHDERERRLPVWRIRNRRVWERDEEAFQRRDERDGEGEEHGE